MTPTGFATPWCHGTIPPEPGDDHSSQGTEPGDGNGGHHGGDGGHHGGNDG